MDSETLRRVEALRAPLEAAYAGNFARLRELVGLGVALRAACDGVIARAPSDELASWREALGGFEAMATTEQEFAIAKGLRLVARFPRAGKAVAAAVRREPPPPPPADPLAAPTSSLPGIGPSFADKLAARGIETVEDLLWLIPRRYDDVRDARPLADLAAMPDGERATFVAKVATSRMVFARGRRWAEVRLGSVERSGSAGPRSAADGQRAGSIDLMSPATALVRWFNAWSGIDKRMPAGSEVVLSGAIRRRGGRLELANPDILGVELPGQTAERAPPAILARYPFVDGVPPGSVRKACAAACARILEPRANARGGQHVERSGSAGPRSAAEGQRGGSIDDGVPPTVEAAASLPDLPTALARLHAPPPAIPPAELAAMNRGDSPWHRRLAFGELFALGVAVALRRRERRSDAAIPCARTPLAPIARALPFQLTRAQQRSIDELGADLARDQPMNRLLQGDVGSGKTAVAFAAAVQVARAGRQTAVMAPTELLAEQHARTWAAWSKPAHLRVELLTASTPRAVRASRLALLAAGKLDVLIGTHALLAESVGFRALGLVVIDEQHRFGVAQRAKLRDKGDGQGAPHLLVMTATPIPRTLALTAYGDLDTSVLDELPPGREPVHTRVVHGAKGVASAYKLVAERVAAGERAYVVCPKVDASETATRDVGAVHAALCSALPSAKVGLVHGRLDAASRDAVMRAFSAGDLDVLVATTVIEVGVDVPAATAMVVHDAERFGLAQLHQLRGRVGRGGARGHCVLIAGATGEDGERRLAVLAETTDGFRIAEEDLALRGPGELLGPRQAGVPRLRFGDLRQHTELLLEARRHADAVLDADPELVRPEHAGLRLAIARRLAHHVYGAEGG